MSEQLLPSSYPEELTALAHFDMLPPRLWVRGRREILDVRPRVAIVGTRRATHYGIRVATELATAFARAGACVVSGLAAGIDGTAHKAALDGGGATIAVLGTGLDMAYPKANRVLQRQIAERGVLLSELEPSEHGWKSTFKERNRIIAALAQLTIVVEAPLSSGALNTANHALTLGRDVAAVPGPIDQPQSAGCNKLIDDGQAAIVASVDRALELAGLHAPARRPPMDPEGDEGRVWSALAEGALDIDSLCHRSGLPAALCLAAVTRLELAGSIECALTGEIRRR